MTSTGDEPLLRPAEQILTKEIREAIAVLQNCVTPIFDVTEKREAELLGSAVLIEVADDIFVGLREVVWVV